MRPAWLLLVLAGCAGKEAAPALRPLPKEVTAENAERTFADCLEQRSLRRGSERFRPTWAGAFNGMRLLGFAKETEREGPTGPWVAVEFRDVQDLEVRAPALSSELPWAVEFRGTFAFGLAEFTYGKMPTSVLVNCADEAAARMLAEAARMLRSREAK
jgi:hypothetical protein